jgi:Lipid A 3-O-deacylase (PagL)
LQNSYVAYYEFLRSNSADIHEIGKSKGSSSPRITYETPDAAPLPLLRLFKRLLWLLGLSAVFYLPCSSYAQQSSPEYSRLNTISFFGKYSNNSSHILLGAARDRRIVSLGAGYERRIFHGKGIAFSYLGELSPVVLLRDPTQAILLTFPTGVQKFIEKDIPTPGRCFPGTTKYADGFMTTLSCSGRWTYAYEISPAGFKINMATHHRLQPSIIGSVGYLQADRIVPVVGSSAFNFLFQFGAGLELFRSVSRSWRAECRFQHYSNDYIANVNPGVDSIVYKVTYSFGR